MEQDLLALTVLLGAEHKYWIEVSLDWIEWTNPKYYHQN